MRTAIKAPTITCTSRILMRTKVQNNGNYPLKLDGIHDHAIQVLIESRVEERRTETKNIKGCPEVEWKESCYGVITRE